MYCLYLLLATNPLRRRWPCSTGLSDVARQRPSQIKTALVSSSCRIATVGRNLGQEQPVALAPGRLAWPKAGVRKAAGGGSGDWSNGQQGEAWRGLCLRLSNRDDGFFRIRSQTASRLNARKS